MTTSLDLGLTTASKPLGNWRRAVGMVLLILISLTAAFVGVRRVGRALPPGARSVLRYGASATPPAAQALPVPNNGAHSPDRKSVV